MKFKIKCSRFPEGDARRFIIISPAVIGCPQGLTMALDLTQAFEYIQRCIDSRGFGGTRGVFDGVDVSA